MVTVLLLRSVEQSYLVLVKHLLKYRYVLFCFQIIATHVSAVCLELSSRTSTLSQELCAEDA